MTDIPFAYNNANSQFYARGIGYPLRGTYIPDQDYALSRDPSAYERMRRDAVVAFALRYRKLLCAGRDWWLEPASAKEEDRLLAKILETLLRELHHFDTARFTLAEAVIAGSRWAKIESEQRALEIDGVDDMDWTVCTRLRDVDKRRFRQYAMDLPNSTRTVRQTTPDGPVVDLPTVNRRWIWQIFRPLQQTWEEIDRDDFVRHVYDEREESLGFGAGLASELYTYWYAKEVALQHGLQYLERWSQGIIIAQVDSLRDGKASFPDSATKANNWLTVLEKMRTRHVLVVDAKDKLDVKDAPTGGWQAALEAIRYLDGAMRVAILGASLPTSQDVSGGSYALAEVQQDTTTALARFDMSGMEETLRQDLIGWLVKANWSNIVKLGLEKCTLPYLRLRESRQDDHQIRADVLLKARQAAMDIRLDEAYAQLGFTPPSKMDRILPPLGMAQSMVQGGDGAGAVEPGSGGVSGVGDTRAGAPNQTDKQARKVIDRVNDQLNRNPIRPNNIAGGKDSREKAIDSITKGFASRVGGSSYGSPEEASFAALMERFGQRVEQAIDRPSRIEIIPKQDPPIVHVYGATNPTPIVNLTLPNAPIPTVNVAAPVVKYMAPSPIIHLSPNITVDIPQTVVNVPERVIRMQVDIPPTVVNVPSPVVNVNLPKPEAARPRVVEIERNDRDGTIAKMTVKEQP